MGFLSPQEVETLRAQIHLQTAEIAALRTEKQELLQQMVTLQNLDFPLWFLVIPSLPSLSVV